MSKKHKKIYLAIPYNGLSQLSFKASNEVASKLIKQGHYVFSPISHSHPIWKVSKDINHEQWLRLDKAFVEWADEVWVVQINGKWGLDKIKKSNGVQRELGWAKDDHKPIKYIKYES